MKVPKYEIDTFFNLNLAAYLVVDVVSTHSDGVHDKLPPLVLPGGAVQDIVLVVFSPEVMTQLVGGHQVGFLQGGGGQ